MTSIQDIVEAFDISDTQLAAYLWRDCVYSLIDCDCEYLSALTPQQLMAFAEYIEVEALIRMDEQRCQPQHLEVVA